MTRLANIRVLARELGLVAGLALSPGLTPALALADAPDWKLISETEDPDKTISWYVDLKSIVHDEDYLRAFLRTS
jgi:hypothetical protein